MLSNRIRNGEDVTKVCTSRVEYMDGGMFHEHFNQDLSSWDVSNVTSMAMFEMHYFNQDSAWDVSNVTYGNVNAPPSCLGCEQCDNDYVNALQPRLSLGVAM